MPVLVTAAHHPLARRLVLRLLDEGGDVRAYSDGDTSVLRAAGAFVASGTPQDEGRLDAACTDVHTVVHVGGGLFTEDPATIVNNAEVLVRAVTSAGIRRLIVLSLPGASPDAGDPLRRAKGEVEAMVAAAEVPSIVIRSSLVATPTLIDALTTAGLDEPTLERPVAPVSAEDLVELIVAFDRARSRAATGHLVAAADGPERLTIRELLARHGGGGSLVGRRLAPTWLAQQLATVLDGPWWTDDPVVVDGWAFAQHTPSALGSG